MLGIGIGLGRRRGGGFSPASIAGLFADYDAAKGLTLVGGKISDWGNQVSGGLSATQGTDADRPTVDAVGINGFQCVALDGSQFLTLPQPFIDAVVAGTYGFFVVCKANTADAMTPISVGDGPHGPLGAISFGGNWLFNYWNGAAIVTESGTPVDTNPVLLDVVGDGTSFKSCVNATQTSAQNDNAGMATAVNAFIGKGAQGGLMFIGSIARICGYDQSIGAANKAKLQAFLKTKYGIA